MLDRVEREIRNRSQIELAHDRGRPGHGLAGEFGLDGPALPGVGHPAAVREMDLPIGDVLAQADPAAHPGAQFPLAAPV